MALAAATSSALWHAGRPLLPASPTPGGAGARARTRRRTPPRTPRPSRLCGRYVLAPTPEGIERRFGIAELVEARIPAVPPRFNIAPPQDVPVVLEHAAPLVVGQFDRDAP